MSDILLTINDTGGPELIIAQQDITLTVSDTSEGVTVEQNNIDISIVSTETTMQLEEKTIELSVNPSGARGEQGLHGIQGVGSVTTIYNEQPAGLINGSNNLFTTSTNFQPGKVSVFINGLLQRFVSHYQTSGTNTIILNDSLTVGDQIEVNYIIL